MTQTDRGADERRVGAIEGAIGAVAADPVVMLPVRLETRFVGSDELRIRVFPDALHAHAHVEEISAEEQAAGRQYWRDRVDGSPAIAWRTLQQKMRAPRAAWVAGRTEPTNLETAKDGDGLAFPSPPLHEAPWTVPPVATALPARWIFAGYRDEAQVLLVMGAPIPGDLPLAPAADPSADDGPETQDRPEDDQTELPIDEGMRWLTDYGAAVAAGMAVTVSDADVDGGLGAGFDRLLVLGVPSHDQADVARLLEAHRHTEGLAVVRQGTPTNNTGAVPSGFDSTGSDLAAALDPAAPQVLPDASADGGRLAAALAVPSAALADMPGADGSEFGNGEAMNRMLWQTTWGYFLDNYLDPMVDDAVAAQMRDHFVGLVRGRGPLPALRVGDQPYGVLPVLAGAHFAAEDAVEARAHQLLGLLTGLWGHAVGRSPFLAKGTSPDADLLDVLESTPNSVSLRARAVLGPAVAANTDGMARLGAAGEALGNWLTEMIFEGQRITGAELAAMPGARPLRLPFVAHGPLSETDPPTPNQLFELLIRLRSGFVSAVHSYVEPSLVAVLARQAALLELAKAAARLVFEHRAQVGGFPLPDKIAPRERELRLVASTEQSLGDILDAPYGPISGAQSMGDHIAGMIDDYLRTRGGPLRDNPATASVADFLDSLDYLATLPAAELDRLIAETLDLCSHRIDAWNTSLATKRLDAIRAIETDRVHIGGFGWLHDVRPETQPDSLGYVHAPSLGQATTAAILRSGYLANRASGDDRFAIDLSAERVRGALELLDAVRDGVSLRALLGYRFERALREHDLELAQYTLDFRRFVPLRTAVGPNQSEPLEELAARDVADGLRLVEIWDERGRSIFGTGRGQIDVAASHQNGVASVIHRLSDQLDAVSDVLVAEGVHQTVHGNLERGAAALDALDRQAPPPEPAVVRTPRSGVGQTHRLLVSLTDSAADPSWGSDRRGDAEPRLNAWVSRLLGDPANVRFAADVVDRSVDDEEPPILEVVETTLAALGLSPLSVVWAAAEGGSSHVSELDERVARALMAEITTVGGELELRLLDGDRAVPTWPAATVGLAGLHTIAGHIRTLIAEARPSQPDDLVDPNADDPLGAVDEAEHLARADAAIAALQSAADQVDFLVSARVDDPAQLTAALMAAADFGIGGVLPEGPEHFGRQLDDAQRVLHRRLADASKASAAGDKLRAVFGNGFVSLPMFVPPGGAELSAALSDRTTLLGGDPLAPAAWLHQTAPVRPGVARLNAVLTGAEAIGANTSPVDLDVVQLPYDAGDRWIALGFDGGKIPAASVGMVVHSPGGFDPAAKQAGLAIDAWNEVVPDPVETTGLSFHYDAPGARAPQTVLVAVPANRANATWSLDEMLALLGETMTMARIRAVDPQRLWMMNTALPAIYLSANSRAEGISTRLFEAQALHIDALSGAGP